MGTGILYLLIIPQKCDIQGRILVGHGSAVKIITFGDLTLENLAVSNLNAIIISLNDVSPRETVAA